MALGQRLKEARQAAGMSQSELAEAVGMTQAAIGALEKRDSKQSSKASELARALGVSVDWLLTGEGPKRKNFDIFASVVKIIADKYRRPGDENLTDQQIYDRYEAEELSAEQERQHQFALETGLYEKAAELESQENDFAGAEAQRNVKLLERASTPGSETSPADNVAKGPVIQGRVPLISWVQAGNWTEAVVPVEPTDVEQWVECPFTHSDLSYALKVVGISMYPEFVEGDIIIVDPTRPHDPGKFVIATKPDSDEATFKKLIQEGDEFFLQAVNSDWPRRIIPLSEGWVVSGVIIGKMKAY